MMNKLMLTTAACLALTCAAPCMAAAAEPATGAVVVSTVDGRQVYQLASDTAYAGAAPRRVVEPEISRWTMLLLGCAGLGAMVRAARRRLLRSINTYAF